MPKYSSVEEFKENMNFDTLHHNMSLTGLTSGKCYYRGDLDNGTVIYMHVSMNDPDKCNYFHYETVFNLLKSDHIEVFIGGETLLWVE